MSFITDTISFFNKPFPHHEVWFGFSRHVVSIALVTGFFLYIFQPNDISDYEGNMFFVCMGFGVAMALSFWLFEFGFRQIQKLFDKPIHWTFGKWLLYSFCVLFVMSLGNFLFIRIVVFGHIMWSLFPAMLHGVLMVVEEKRYNELAGSIDVNKVNHKVSNDNSEISLFEISLQKVKYVEALQNYVTIGYIDDKGHFKTKTERATLKSMISDSEGQSIIQTHKSFLVNRNAIVNIEGNSQGLMLTLSDCEKRIPVSRSFVSTIKSLG